MSKAISRLGVVALVLAVLGGAPPASDARRPVRMKAELAEACSNCATDTSWSYSLLPDSFLGYLDGDGVESRILTHNSVYTLDTLDTLVNGLVGSGTRFLKMHFYSPVEGQFPGHVLPACWQGSYDQWQAVNWSVFSSNTVAFTDMEVGQSYGGFSRLDFNVRNGICDNQIFRYYLRWYNVCIKRTAENTWEVTSGPCGAMVNYGEANLRGQGGRKKETVDYGDWRLPFKLLLTVQ